MRRKCAIGCFFLFMGITVHGSNIPVANTCVGIAYIPNQSFAEEALQLNQVAMEQNSALLHQNDEMLKQNEVLLAYNQLLLNQNGQLKKDLRQINAQNEKLQKAMQAEIDEYKRHYRQQEQVRFMKVLQEKADLIREVGNLSKQIDELRQESQAAKCLKTHL